MTSTATTTGRSKQKKRAAVSFTGGKDCHLAMERCLASGEFEIVCLVIFYPLKKEFKAHPIQWQQVQATALNLPLAMYCTSAVDGCYKKGYARGIQELRTEYAIDTIITGDIDYVGSMKTNFMTEVCETHVPEVTIQLPLWQGDRRTLLNDMLERKFHIIFSCVKEPMEASWIGRRLDQGVFDELEKLGVDLTGENGEYHTMVLCTPSYACPLKLVNGAESLELKDQPSQKQRWWVCSPNTKLEKES